MARDLTREVSRQSRNGQEVAELVDEVLGRPEAEQPAPTTEPGAPTMSEHVAAAAERRERYEGRRDWMLARIAVMLIDAAKLLDPITRILVARLLAVLSLVAATGIALYTIRLTEGWERVAVAGIFTALAALLIRRGQS